MTPDELPIADGGPCDPDRAYDWRDSGDGAEDADDAEPPIGEGLTGSDREEKPAPQRQLWLLRV